MKNIKKHISTIITLFVLILFAIYLFKNPEIVKELLSINPVYILLIMVIYLVIFFVEGLFIIVTLEVFNKKVDYKEGFYISTLSRIGNYLLPMRAGAVFRATYLKKKYDFDYSNFLSTLYGYYIIFFLTNSVLAFTVLLLKLFVYEQSYLKLLMFFALVILGMMFLIFVRFPFEKIFKNSKGVVKKVINFLEKFLSGWDMIVQKKGLFLKLIYLAFANILLNILVVNVEFFSIGKIGNILDTVLYTCISGVSLLISITPGSLGLREAVLLITSKSLGLSEQEIMKLAFLDRGIMFILLLISLIFITLLFKKYSLKDVFFVKEKKK